MDESEWEAYKGSFHLAMNQHQPSDPPSFPVLVVSVIKNEGYGSAATDIVRHSFVEVHDLKRLLNLP